MYFSVSGAINIATQTTPVSFAQAANIVKFCETLDMTMHSNLFIIIQLKVSTLFQAKYL